MRDRIAALVVCLLVTASVHSAEVWREPTTGMEFVRMDKGCFVMGVASNAFAAYDMDLHERAKTEMPSHEVCLDAFWIGRFEVKQAEWNRLLKGAVEPFPTDERPMAGIGWREAVDFANRLTEASAGKYRFRLPSEAEWEYACRAGANPSDRPPSTDALDPKAWYSSSYQAPFSGVRIHSLQPVGRKAANAWGLHDMLGNVWEWTRDAYLADGYRKHPLYNPVIEGPGDRRVIRGGGLRTGARMVRCEGRAWLTMDDSMDTVGFRLVREE